MAKRKTANETSRQGPWHICDQCIDPLARGLRQIGLSFLHLAERSTIPYPHNLHLLYASFHVELATVWLKLHESVDFAGDFEKTIYRPLRSFERAYSRAVQTVEDDPKTKGTSWPEKAEAVRRLLLDPESGRENRPGGAQEGGQESTVHLPSEIATEFFRAARYLELVSAVMRAKKDDRDLQLREASQLQNGKSPNDDRDAWIYDQCWKGTPLSTIVLKLKKKTSWGWIGSPQGIRSAAKRYAKRHALELPPIRQPGRLHKREN